MNLSKIYATFDGHVPEKYHSHFFILLFVSICFLEIVKSTLSVNETNLKKIFYIIFNVYWHKFILYENLHLLAVVVIRCEMDELFFGSSVSD